MRSPPCRVGRPHTTGGNKGGVARNELCWEYRDLIFNLSAQLGFSNGAASCTNLPRARPSVVRVRSWRLVRTRDFRRCVVRVSAAAADRCAQSGDPTRTEQGRSHVAARGSEFYRFTGWRFTFGKTLGFPTLCIRTQTPLLGPSWVFNLGAPVRRCRADSDYATTKIATPSQTPTTHAHY